MLNPGYWWLIAAVVMFIIEAVSIQLISIWFAIAALVMIPISGSLDTSVQLLIFSILSLILLIVTRPVVKKINANRSNRRMNIDSIIGRQGVVRESIDNVQAVGRVEIDGVLWIARSDNDDSIEKDSVVEIKQISGAKLIVKKI